MLWGETSPCLCRTRSLKPRQAPGLGRKPTWRADVADRHLVVPVDLTFSGEQPGVVADVAAHALGAQDLEQSPALEHATAGTGRHLGLGAVPAQRAGDRLERIGQGDALVALLSQDLGYLILARPLVSGQPDQLADEATSQNSIPASWS